LLPIARYGVGATLPPHLSPWVNDEEEGYKPAYAEEVERLKNGEVVEADNEMVAAASEGDESEAENLSAEDNGSDEEDDDTSKAKKSNKESKAVSVEFCCRCSRDVCLLSRYPNFQLFCQDKEAHDLAKVMMSKKASRLYGRMQHGLEKKQEKVEALKKRREEIETSTNDKSANKKRKTKS
jgi:pescadillo protein